MTDGVRPAKYEVAKVEAVILEVVAELDPNHLTAKELALRIVSDAEDIRELETVAQAMQGLREFGLLSDGDGEMVTPTPAGFRAIALLT